VTILSEDKMSISKQYVVRSIKKMANLCQLQNLN